MTSKAEKVERERTQQRRSIELCFLPGPSVSSYDLRVVEGFGSRRITILRWHGHLPIGRDALAGRLAPDVTAMLCGELWAHLADDPALPDALTRPEASAPPEGDMGAAVHDVPLPGLGVDSLPGSGTHRLHLVAPKTRAGAPGGADPKPSTLR